MNKKNISKKKPVETNKVNPAIGRWLEEDRCGCSFVAKTKGELIGYCGKHGENRRNIYRLPEATQCGLS